MYGQKREESRKYMKGRKKGEAKVLELKGA